MTLKLNMFVLSKQSVNVQVSFNIHIFIGHLFLFNVMMEAHAGDFLDS